MYPEEKLSQGPIMLDDEGEAYNDQAPRRQPQLGWRLKAFFVLHVAVLLYLFCSSRQSSFAHKKGPPISPDGWFRLVYPNVHHAYQRGAANADVCLTPECVHAASEILYNLSPDYKDLDPCTDFEELVCGGWRDRHDLRPDQGDAFTGTIMSEASQMLLRHILEAPYPDTSEVGEHVSGTRSW
jgi:hypothetical protein